MGGIWFPLTAVVVGSIMLALGLVWGTSVLIVLGVLGLALAALSGVQGRLPEGH